MWQFLQALAKIGFGIPYLIKVVKVPSDQRNFNCGVDWSCMIEEWFKDQNSVQSEQHIMLQNVCNYDFIMTRSILNLVTALTA